MKNARYSSLFYSNILLLLMLTIVGSTKGLSQGYSIPDANFRNALSIYYSSLMSGDMLDTVDAKAYGGDLILPYKSIEDVDGIQFFENVETINLVGNQLTDFDELSQLKNIQRLYLNDNKLESLPDISHCTELIDLHVSDNKLLALPSLFGLTKLNSLYCSNNQLTALPEFSSQLNMSYLVAGNNPYEDQLSLKELENLIELHVHQSNLLDTINGLSKMKNLAVLYAWGNNLTDLSVLNSNTTLQVFEVFHNNLSGLPNLLNKPNLNQVSFINNRLTFEDILPLMEHPNFSNFQYSSQLNFFLEDVEVRESTGVVVSPTIDTQVEDLVYKWYKDDLYLTDQNGPALVLSDFNSEHVGQYKLVISHPDLNSLWLVSNTFNVSVLPCLEIVDSSYSIINENCNAQASIDLSTLEMVGGNGTPFNFNVTNSTLDIDQQSTIIENIPTGEYEVIVYQNDVCNDSFSLTITSNQDCDLVFSPDGDGFKDTYYIEDEGSAQIFDHNRNLVKEILCPGEWDGYNDHGEKANPGLYVIVINSEKIVRLTLID